MKNKLILHTNNNVNFEHNSVLEDGTRSEDDDSNEEEGDYGAMLEGEADEAHTRAAPTLISSEEPKKKKKKKRAEKCKVSFLTINGVISKNIVSSGMKIIDKTFNSCT